MSCYFASAGLKGPKRIYWYFNDNSMIPTSHEILFPINDVTDVNKTSSDLHNYSIGCWNVKDKIKTHISLIQ